MDISEDINSLESGRKDKDGRQPALTTELIVMTFPQNIGKIKDLKDRNLSIPEFNDTIINPLRSMC